MKSLRAKGKLYWEQEISLDDYFKLSTLKNVLAIWYHVQCCTSCIFTGSHKILMGWPAAHSIVSAAPLDSSMHTLSFATGLTFSLFKCLIQLK